MWYLCENVYMVTGYENAAIYDFNRNLLFQLNSEAKNTLIRALKEEWKYMEEENIFFNSLERQGIITHCFVEKHDIHELVKEPKIDFVWIEITTSCNLKCIHCYDEAAYKTGTIMDYEQYCHIIDELLKIGVQKIQFIGGEPFILGKNIFRYLDYAVGKFEYIEIFTNGTLLKETWLEYIKNNNIRLALSVYSYIEEEHNKITKDNSSWKKTNAIIKKIKEKGIKYRVKNVIMSDLRIGEKNTNLYTLSEKRDIVRLVGRADQELMTKELLKKKLITRKSFTKPLNKVLVQRIVSGHNCFSRRLYFSTDLNVYPCVMERRLCHGNIKDKSLDQTINKSLMEMGKDYIQECQDCEFRYTCFDCRPDSNMRNVNEKPWYCTYNPYNGHWENEDSFIDNILES